MSYKPEIEVSWAPGVWHSPHALAFETESEAQQYADWLLIRFGILTRARAARSANPITHRWVAGDLLYVGDRP
jgi:hypothetical protein